MTTVIIRMGLAGNGVPCFIAPGQGKELGRPFGAVFDDSRCLWQYPAYYPTAKKVLADLKMLPFQVQFSDTALAHVQQLARTEAEYNTQTLPAEFTYVTSPFEHQRLGLSHVYHMWRSALFYAPGLGKSKIAIDLLRLLKMQRWLKMGLIMGPLVTIRNWGAEIERHSGGGLTWSAVLGTTRDDKKAIIKAADKCELLLVTYDTAWRYREEIFAQVPYNIVIADESHLIKEWSSSRTKGAWELGQKAARKLIMTGTPTLGSPLDLYGQYKFLADAFMPESYIAYKMKFLEVAPHNKHLVLGYKNMDVLNGRTQFVAIRKTKEECLDLPPQTIVDITFDLAPKQMVVFDALVVDMGLDLNRLQSIFEGATDLPPDTQLPHVAVLLNKLSQISSGFLLTSNRNLTICNGCQFMQTCVEEKIEPYTKRCQVVQKEPPATETIFDDNPKLNTLEELLDTILGDPSNKVIVWCRYRVELNIVEEKLKQLELGYVRVDGTTGSKIQDVAALFNNDPAIKVYLAQVSTGVGITLNAANYMVYYSLDYSLGNYDQSKDRNYRIGQTRNVTIYRLLGKETIDPLIASLLDNKVDVDQALTNPHVFVKAMAKVVVKARPLSPNFEGDEE